MPLGMVLSQMKIKHLNMKDIGKTTYLKAKENNKPKITLILEHFPKELKAEMDI